LLKPTLLYYKKSSILLKKQNGAFCVYISEMAVLCGKISMIFSVMFQIQTNTEVKIMGYNHGLEKKKFDIEWE